MYDFWLRQYLAFTVTGLDVMQCAFAPWQCAPGWSGVQSDRRVCPDDHWIESIAGPRRHLRAVCNCAAALYCLDRSRLHDLTPANEIGRRRVRRCS